MEHPPLDNASPYRGRRVAVGTRHGKQHQFAPAFAAVLGAELITPDDLDTDQFGTFTGEVTRRESAMAAARNKAHLAMAVTGLPYGLASEASYGPMAGGWHGHEEILLFCDEVLGIEVLDGHRSLSVPGMSHRVRGLSDVPQQLLAGLPSQALIARPSGPATGGAVKGVTDTTSLADAIAAAAAACPEGVAIVEPDLRAHHNPSRRQVLIRLAETLAHRLATRCPACGLPGFGRLDTEPGLRCRVCETPTPLVRNEIHGCAGCPHRAVIPVPIPADPAACTVCNP